MKKLTKRINLLALSMLCVGCCLCAGAVGFHATVQAASAMETEFANEVVEKATFNSLWPNMDAYNATDRILLRFDSTTVWDSTNKGNFSSKVTYKNSETGATYSPTDNDIAGWSGQRWIVFTGTTDYDIIQIADGGQFGGVEIPAITLYKVNGRLYHNGQHEN